MKQQQNLERKSTPIGSSAYTLKVDTAYALARAHFPELDDVPIFVERKKANVSRAFDAQPRFRNNSLSYRIMVNENNHNKTFLENISEQELIGAFGHELGHIAQYKNKSIPELILFGVKYVRDPKFLREVEIDASMRAVKNGLGHEVLAAYHAFMNEPTIASDRKLATDSDMVPRFSEVKQYLRNEKKFL